MRRAATYVSLGLVLLLAAFSSALSQQIETVIRSIDGSQPLIRPTRIALSPSGDRVAVCDQGGNRIYVIDVDGHSVWSVGIGSTVTRPVLIGFETDNAVLYYDEQVRTVFRSSESNPDVADTVVSFPDTINTGLHFDQIMAVGHGQTGYLAMDRDKSSMYRLKADWTVDRKLIASGSGKGKLWSPSDFSVDLSGNIVVADEAGCPVKVFTPEGKPLFCGGWNLNDADRSWTASAVGMGPGEVIWAADVTNLSWRLFDRAGIQIAKYPFEQSTMKPNSLVFTPDRRMFIAEDNGAVVIMSLPQ